MTSKTISAAVNPALANNLIKEAMAEKPKQVEVKIVSPSDTSVTLPGGYITDAGEVVTDAEVRELNGRDEEAIARSTNVGKAFLTILQRGTVRIGDKKVDDELLNELLSGDRDMLLLSIFKVTFGAEPEVATYCYTCKEAKTVNVDIDTDIKVRKLEDPINDRVFTVQGKRSEFLVQLPTGSTQKELMLSSDKTAAELNTILLEKTVVQIDGSPVLSKFNVQNIGLVDRKKIIEEINNRIPGPQFEPLQLTCPDCESEVSVPISLGSFFRF
jgi:hypothetical protein